MSLDVYLEVETPQRTVGGSGIFVREAGQTREISREEWDRRFPGREPVVVTPTDGETREVYSANITHNLNRMAHEAGIYTALWRPVELDPAAARRINEQEEAGNYHGPGGAFEIERNLPPVHARDLIQPLRDGLAKMQGDPERFKAFNPENGWGSYAGFVPWVADYLAACERWPNAVVRVSR